MDFDLNLEAAHDGDHESQDNRSESVSICTICHEPLTKDDNRTSVTLQCGHQFHLDCIGSAFNGKKEMRCPNCRNLEQGRWSIPRDNPDPNTGAAIVFSGFGIYSSALIFGCDLCPFEGSGSGSIYNSVEEFLRLDQSDDFHKPGPEGRHYCPFVEYLFTIVGPQNDLNSQQIAGGWDPMSPLTPIPTNPRLFQSDSHPRLIIARRYFAHPVIDPPTINVILGNVSIPADDQVVPSYLRNNLAANGSVHPRHLGGSVLPNASMANDSVVQPSQDTNFVANVPLVQPYSSDNLAANASLHHFHPGGNLVPNALMNNHSVVRPYQDINLVANAPLVQSYPWDNLAANGSVHRFHLGDNAPVGYDSAVQPHHVNLVANGGLVPPSPNDNFMYNYAHGIMPNVPIVASSNPQGTIGTNAPMVPPSPSTSSVANAVALPYHCNNIVLYDCGCNASASSDGGTSRNGGGEPF